MDVNDNKTCISHPLAVDFLFEHKRKVSSIFRQVLGHFDIDHIALTIVDDDKRLLFLSSTPAIEYNLIISGLLQYDRSMSSDFINANLGKPWRELYHPEKYKELYSLKQHKHRISAGISIPIIKNNTSLIYSFATKSKKYSHCGGQALLVEQDKLIKMGDFCFEEIARLISFQELTKNSILTHSLKTKKLKLIVNNTTRVGSVHE